jgi:hypothetical protein
MKHKRSFDSYLEVMRLRDVFHHFLLEYANTIDIYHFSSVSADPGGNFPEKLMLKPEQMSHTEMKRSIVPRIYFYPDDPKLAYKDTPAIRGRRLYKSAIPASDIYDISEDPAGIVERAKNEYGFTNQDQMFGEISGYEHPKTNPDKWETKSHWRAAYLRSNQFDTIIVFEPVEVELVQREQKQQMMKRERK